MFTGLVQSVGVIREIAPASTGSRLTIDAGAWRHRPERGESISVAGCCLTVAQEPRDGNLIFDVVAETLRRTTLGMRQTGDRVNLEHAARADTLLGGHIVQGHIDGVGEVVGVDSGDEYRVRVAPPADLMELLPPKGSVAIEGVSLTIASVGDDWFEVALIPTTLRDTTLGDLTIGDRCNLESDILARTVAHWLTRMRA